DIEELYKLCKFDFTPEENKRRAINSAIREKYPFRNIQKGRGEILAYFKDCANKGELLKSHDIQKHFHTSLKKYFPGGIKDLYELAQIELPYRLRDKNKLRVGIIRYVKLRSDKGHYPTYMELDEKFHTNIKGLFSGIREVYSAAGVEYRREPNPFIKYEKEERLTKICIKIFKRQGYEVKRVSIGPSSPEGADIVLYKSGKLIPVEIKAYHKFGKIGKEKNSKSYLRDEVKQISRYIRDLKGPYGFLVTSTNRVVSKEIPSNVRLLIGRDIRKLLIEYAMNKELKDLDWIKNTYTSYSKEDIIKLGRKRVLEYVKSELEKGRYVSRREICEKFKINLNTYFSNTKDVYQRLGVDPYSLPSHRMGGQSDKSILRDRILKFVQEEAKKGSYPTYKEIQGRFRCLPKLYFPGGIREMYKIAGVPYNRKFANKTIWEKEGVRERVIDYLKKSNKVDHPPTYEEIKTKFKIDIISYFKGGIREIYDLAGVRLPPRQGLSKT
ncbi:MAG: restriction endonuclease, partial [Candidatus Altiarchaeota archaeon]|nr:restriction endonuclease [Candidatus Altiarchaeota archaeon]